MKKLSISAFALFIAIGASAQESEPIWITKDVQRIEFAKRDTGPADIRTTDALPVSKGVAVFRQKDATPSAAVRRTGTPAAVISKPVARMQVEK